MRIPTVVALWIGLSALAGASVAAASTGGAAPGPATQTRSAPPAHRPVTGTQVVRYAKRFTGVPYAYGANGPRSFDCSGFTSYVFKRFGVRLSRSSYAQMRQGSRVRGRLHVGDLVFWEGGGHVGIYTGNSRFISATVHRGIWTYSFKVWRATQSYTTARRILGSPTNAPATGASARKAAFGAHLPRNGGPADATPQR